MRKHPYTNSEMETSANCPRLWYYRYYLGLRPVVRTTTGSLALGSRIHAALEAWNRDRDRDPLEEWGALVDADAARMAASGLPVDALSEEAVLGAAMLEGYVEWEEEEGGHADYETIAVEQALSKVIDVPLRDGGSTEVELRGKLDRLLLARDGTGAVWIADYKTTKSFSETSLTLLERSPQPRLYAMLLEGRLQDGRWLAGALYTMLRKVKRGPRSKPPYYMSMKVPMPPNDIEQHRARTLGIVAKLVDTALQLDRGADPRAVAPFQVSWRCTTCEFRLPCRLAQDTGTEASNEALADNFVAGDPWDRYGDEHSEEDAV